MGKLKIGQPTPDFALLNQDGKVVRLADFSGRKLVMHFYPKDNTPRCSREAEGFRAPAGFRKELLLAQDQLPLIALMTPSLMASRL